MDRNYRSVEFLSRHGLFDPKYHVIASTVVVVTEFMIQADFSHLPGFDKRNRLLWPINSRPAFRRFPFVVKENLHMLQAA